VSDCDGDTGTVRSGSSEMDGAGVDGAGVVRAGSAELPAEHAASASVSAPASIGTARRELRSTSAG
jgi:hypothetical protein